VVVTLYKTACETDLAKILVLIRADQRLGARLETVKVTEMPQEQRIIPLILSNHHRQAVATGNNAAWHCECGRALPLIGRTGALATPSEAMIIECQDCSRRYFVVPRDKDLRSSY
jgi:DNA-directed RNA polymerase subunit RPC12/RpoP